MKKVIVLLSLILVIFLLIYFLLSRLTRDLNPFPTKGDQVKVDITRPSDIPDNMEIKNKSKIKVKVYAYDYNDPVRWVERAKWDLNPGQSASYPLDNYRFKVFKPGAILPAKSGIIGSREVEITGDQKNIKISGQPKKKVTFTNKTSENIRIIAYKPEDPLHAAGFIGWYLVVGHKDRMG